MGNARMRISCFIYALTGGGAQRRTIAIVNGFAARGHEVELVVVSDHGELAGELDRRVKLRVLDSASIRFFGVAEGRRRLRGLQTAASVVALARYLRRERPEVLLSAANHVNLVSVLARLLARSDVRLVLRTSNHPSGNLNVEPRVERLIRILLRWMARHVYPLADAVIAVSDGVADDLSELTGIARESITTIYNPIVTPRLLEQARVPVDHDWLAPGAPPVVLAVGTLKLQKDFPCLLRAFAAVRATRPVRLVVLGEGAARRKLERLATSLGVARDVSFPGYAANPYAWMSRASVLVLSSRWEGLPGVLIEAMACGCPVVSTDCPSGPSEILDHGTYGPLVPVGDADLLASAICKALDEPVDSGVLRTRAGFFSTDKAIDRYLEVLREDSGSCPAPAMEPVSTS